MAKKIRTIDNSSIEGEGLRTLQFAAIATIAEVRNATIDDYGAAIISDGSTYSLYLYDSADNTSTDNGDTILVSISGKRYKKTPPPSTATDISGIQAQIDTINSVVITMNNDETQSITATEPISAGDFVNVYDLGGSARIRKAIATSPALRAHGYVKNAVSTGASGLVFYDKINSSISGLTSGTGYFLSDIVPGGVSLSVPTVSGRISQSLGYATTPTRIKVNIEEPLIIA